MENQSIAEKNDQFRKALSGCRVVLTAGVADCDDIDTVIAAVKNFKKFTKGNDPYGERDFAFVQVRGSRYFFKFDYYDSNYEFFQEDGHRVLNIGRAEEY